MTFTRQSSSPKPIKNLQRLRPAKPLLTLEGVSVCYGATTAINNIDLSLYHGELVSLIGPNGAGKSTLVQVLLGVTTCTTGNRVVHEPIISAYVPQNFQVNPLMPMSVKDLLMLEKPKPTIFDTVVQQCQCGHLLTQSFHALSGGQRQQVALARALMRQPQLLVLDEPTQGLDPVAERLMNDLIEQLKQQRVLTMLVVSHDLNWVFAGTDRVICLNKHICCTGKPSQVEQNPHYLHLYGAHRVQYTHHHDQCQHGGVDA